MSEELLNGNQTPEVPETKPEEKNEGEQKQSKSYSQEDVDEIVKKRLARERKKLSSMLTEEEQTSELVERERNILKRELMADAKLTLIDHGLPGSLAEILNYDSKEDHEENLKKVMDIFDAAVEEGVKMRVRGVTPKASRHSIDPDSGIAKAFSHK